MEEKTGAFDIAEIRKMMQGKAVVKVWVDLLVIRHDVRHYG